MAKPAGGLSVFMQTAFHHSSAHHLSKCSPHPDAKAYRFHRRRTGF
jgi:hypothetical protein